MNRNNTTTVHRKVKKKKLPTEDRKRFAAASGRSLSGQLHNAIFHAQPGYVLCVFFFVLMRNADVKALPRIYSTVRGSAVGRYIR